MSSDKILLQFSLSLLRSYSSNKQKSPTLGPISKIPLCTIPTLERNYDGTQIFRISKVFTIFINDNEQTVADSAQEPTFGKYR